MRFKSKAQRRKFAELLVKGEISPETYEEWNRDTGGAKLPERVTPATRGRKKRRKTSKTRTKTRTKARTKTRAKARRPSKARSKPKRSPKRRSR
jgi:hypothetical protein